MLTRQGAPGTSGTSIAQISLCRPKGSGPHLLADRNKTVEVRPLVIEHQARKPVSLTQPHSYPAEELGYWKLQCPVIRKSGWKRRMSLSYLRFPSETHSVPGASLRPAPQRGPGTAFAHLGRNVRGSRVAWRPLPLYSLPLPMATSQSWRMPGLLKATTRFVIIRARATDWESNEVRRGPEILTWGLLLGKVRKVRSDPMTPRPCCS